MGYYYIIMSEQLNLNLKPTLNELITKEIGTESLKSVSKIISGLYDGEFKKTTEGELNLYGSIWFLENLKSLHKSFKKIVLKQISKVAKDCEHLQLTEQSNDHFMVCKNCFMVRKMILVEDKQQDWFGEEDTKISYELSDWVLPDL